MVYVLLGATQPPADISPYPTTAIRCSVRLMGPMVAGVVEELAFRGYMQSHLERIGPTFAILMTSTVFTLLHGTHGLAHLVTVAPGFFLASAVYGYLARRSSVRAHRTGRSYNAAHTWPGLQTRAPVTL